MRIKLSIAFLFGVFCQPIYAETPLSAIDWLNDANNLPLSLPLIPPDEAETARQISTSVITTSSLEGVTTNATGLLPPHITGLPRNLWGVSTSGDLADGLLDLRSVELPSLLAFTKTLLLAELDPPIDSDRDGLLFLARIDVLIAFGAVEEAKALLERAGVEDAARFQRWFDVSLLTGTEEAACAALRSRPNLSDDFRKRVFCLARDGEWEAAMLTYETANALSQFSDRDAALLDRFLADGLGEVEGRLPPPNDPDPLTYRLYEAIGEPFATTTLPLAFAHADLRANIGWKAQIEAAERLARKGAISENKLLGLYSERRPAASGGVWDRVAAIQRLDEALTAGDVTKIQTALPTAWQYMKEAELEIPFAALYAERLSFYPLEAPYSDLAFQISLLSQEYEKSAQNHVSSDQRDTLLIAIATGQVESLATRTGKEAAILDGFLADPTERASGISLGADLITATTEAQAGALGDLSKLSRSLAYFRSVGLEDLSRRIALQVLLLGPRG